MTTPYKGIGTAGLDRQSNFVYEEFLPNLRYPQASRVFREMSSNDPVIGSIMYMVEQLIRKSGWAAEPYSNSPEDAKNAEFLESCMNDMRMTWANTITEILSELVYGFSFHEIIYKIRRGPYQKSSSLRSMYNDGKIGWHKIPIRAQSTLYGWEFAEDGDIKAFIQEAPPHYKQVTIPLNRGLLFRTKVSRDNPEGRSLLRNAYRPWYFKKRMEEIEGIGIERDLAGLPVVTPPAEIDIWNPQNPVAVRYLAQAQKLVKNIRRDASEGVVKPSGWELELLSTGGSRQFDTNAIINRYDNRIAITLLADIVMMGGDKVGSFALGEVKQSLLSASLEALIADIADIFNKYAVPQLFMLNGLPIDKLPKIKPGEIETPNIKDLAFILRAGGLDITKDIKLMNMLRRLISVDPLSEEEFDKMYRLSSLAEDQEANSNANSDLEQNNKANINDPVGHSMDDNSSLDQGR